jgi:hypothetical protein
VRIDDRPVRSHDPVSAPDVVLVQDPTLLRGGDVLTGLSPSGVLVVNLRGNLSPEVRTAVGPDVRVLTVEASETALRLIGRDVPGRRCWAHGGRYRCGRRRRPGRGGPRALHRPGRRRGNADAVLETYSATLASAPEGGRRAATG